MIYQLNAPQEDLFLQNPETGMGYQIVEARKKGQYDLDRFLVLNAELVFEMDGNEVENIRKSLLKDEYSIKASTEIINLVSVRFFSELEFKNMLMESKLDTENGAIDNPEENANGTEVFVRLSAFNNDKRVDKVKKCLLPGSFTTTMGDYLQCKNTKDDPIERYALPSSLPIIHAFHIRPVKTDTLQRGIVQPAFGKRGGGKEAYFAKGTASVTFILQTAY